MAVMTDPQRVEAWADFMRELSDAREPLGLTKPELRAFFDAADQWVSDNMASFNSAIPQPARGAMTAAQKARGLARILEKRFKVGT